MDLIEARTAASAGRYKEGQAPPCRTKAPTTPSACRSAPRRSSSKTRAARDGRRHLYVGSRERVASRSTMRCARKTREPSRICALPRPPAGAASARRQPEMHQMLARRHLPARRGGLSSARSGARVRLNPSADYGAAVYVQEPGARVTKSARTLVIDAEAGKTEVAIGDVSELVLQRANLADDAGDRALCARKIPVTWASRAAGWLGIRSRPATAMSRSGSSNSAPRSTSGVSLAFARSLVSRKFGTRACSSAATFKAGDEAERDAALETLSRLADRAAHAMTENELLASKARRPLAIFACSAMFGDGGQRIPAFSFEKRTRRRRRIRSTPCSRLPMQC